MAGLLEASAYTFNSIDYIAANRMNPDAKFQGFNIGFFIYDPGFGYYTIGDYHKCSPVAVVQLYLSDLRGGKPCHPGVHKEGTWRFTDSSINANRFVGWLYGIECVWTRSEGTDILLKAAARVGGEFYVELF
jgi:hypothetical protein